MIKPRARLITQAHNKHKQAELDQFSKFQLMVMIIMIILQTSSRISLLDLILVLWHAGMSPLMHHHQSWTFIMLAALFLKFPEARWVISGCGRPVEPQLVKGATRNRQSLFQDCWRVTFDFDEIAHNFCKLNILRKEHLGIPLSITECS